MNSKVQPDFAGLPTGEASTLGQLKCLEEPTCADWDDSNQSYATTAISGELTAVRQDLAAQRRRNIQWNSFVVRDDTGRWALLPGFPRLSRYHPRWYLRASRLWKYLSWRAPAPNWVNVALPGAVLLQCTPRQRWASIAKCRSLRNLFRRCKNACSLYKRSRSTDWRTNQYRQHDSIARSITLRLFCSTLDFTALIRYAR